MFELEPEQETTRREIVASWDAETRYHRLRGDSVDEIVARNRSIATMAERNAASKRKYDRKKREAANG